MKMDRSLIAEIDQRSRSLAIARAIIALCRDLNLELTAEGVERPEQLALLSSEPGLNLQGYSAIAAAGGQRNPENRRDDAGTPAIAAAHDAGCRGIGCASGKREGLFTAPGARCRGESRLGSSHRRCLSGSRSATVCRPDGLKCLCDLRHAGPARGRLAGPGLPVH